MEGHASIVPISQGRSKARRGQSSSQMAHARPMLPALTHSSGPALKRRGVWKFCPIPAAGESASWVPRLPQHPLRPMPTRPAHENPGHSGDCGRNFWVSRWSSPRLFCSQLGGFHLDSSPPPCTGRRSSGCRHSMKGHLESCGASLGTSLCLRTVNTQTAGPYLSLPGLPSILQISGPSDTLHPSSGWGGWWKVSPVAPGETASSWQCCTRVPPTQLTSPGHSCKNAGPMGFCQACQG
ncbi:uncharacterized protein [Symphalangus syndactylus]|uniref:uncharacterized protein isoform X1 n=1 Tax=Symphalangus syndactylus TaxID=9590 RepID=UPI003004ED8A